MNPYKLREIYKYLTRAKKVQPDLPNVFPASKAPIPPKTQNVEEMEAINRFVRSERQQKAGGGMLVQPSADGSRPGYKEFTSRSTGKTYSDKKTKEFKYPRKNKEGKIYYYKEPKGQQEVYMSKDFKKWYNKTHFNNKNSSYYKKTIDSLPNDIRNTMAMKQFPFAQKVLEAEKEGYVRARDWLNENKISYKKFDFARNAPEASTFYKKLAKDIGGIKIGDSLYIKKPNAKFTKEIIRIFNNPDPIMQSHTVENVTQLLKDPKYRKIFLSGSYPTMDQYPKNIGSGKMSTAISRIAQLLSGHKFENFFLEDVNIKVNKSIAKKIQNKIAKEPFGSANRTAFNELKMEVITNAMPEYFDTGIYKSWKKNARKILKDAGIDLTDLDINELTGLSSAFNNKQYTSSQFVNLMNSEFNQKWHGNMLREYGRAEEKLQKVLSGKKPNFDQAVKIVKDWEKWRDGWFEGRMENAKSGAKGVPEKYRLQEIKKILPSFKVGTDAATSAFTKSRLKELSGLGLNIREEAAASKYIKTFGTKKSMSETPVLKEIMKGDPKAMERLLLQKIGCPGFKAADGGRATFDVGTNCQIKGANLINSGMKNASPAQLKNFAAFANRTASLGRGVMKYGVIPEALYVAADSLVRMGMGDNLDEAFLRATNYLTPSDNVKKAEMLEADRFFGPEVAGIIGKSLDYKNELAKVQSLEDKKANLENLSGGGEFDYIGNLNQDVKNIDAQIKQTTDNLNNKFKMTDAEQIYADRMQKEVDDARTANSFFTKLKSKFRDLDQDQSDIETLGMPEKTQEQLNEKILPAFGDSKEFMQYTTQDAINLAQAYRAQGSNVSAKDILAYRDSLKNSSLSELVQKFNPESVYGASGTMGEPINKPTMEKKQNVIGDMEKEIVGQTNAANRFDLDLSMIGSGLRGFAAAGGGIAKEAGDSSGVAPTSGPNPQGLLSLKNRVRNY